MSMTEGCVSAPVVCDATSIQTLSRLQAESMLFENRPERRERCRERVGERRERGERVRVNHACCSAWLNCSKRIPVAFVHISIFIFSRPLFSLITVEFWIYIFKKNILQISIHERDRQISLVHLSFMQYSYRQTDRAIITADQRKPTYSKIFLTKSVIINRQGQHD